MAPVVHELQRERFDFKICVTGQHREMLDQVLNFFQITPDYDLRLMKTDQSINGLSSGILSGIDKILLKEKPDLVLIQGDTSTSLIIALAAFNLQIAVGHIEAGLRTSNLKAPFPEEGNRQLISRITDFHFVPTCQAKRNLMEEIIPGEKINHTGNTIVDALEYGRGLLEAGYENEGLRKIKSLRRSEKKLILVTGHRRENFGFGLENICNALLEIGKRGDAQIIFPVHLNPQVKKLVYERMSGRNNIILIDPVDYPTLLWLIMESSLIISDSGGIQEEAPSFHKPVIVTREVTERMEGVRTGFSFLTGTSKERIIDEAFRLLDNPPNYNGTTNPYGDGRASKRITDFLKNID